MADSFVVQVIVAVVSVVLVAMAEMTGAVLSRVTVTAVEVARLPDVSRATATMDFDPLDVAVLSQVTAYGEDVSSAPIITPPTLNVTPATAVSSDAVAESVMDAPETVAPSAGAVSETVGAVVSDAAATVGLPPPPGLDAIAPTTEDEALPPPAFEAVTI